MNDVIDIKAKAVIERTPEIIAVEINSIKNQIQQAMLTASISIGRKLTEAQHLVEKGCWGQWLQENVDYSERTASNLMRIFKEYGQLGQQELFDAPANRPEFAKLSYTQAVALLGLPSEDAKIDFINNNPIDDMSTRELQAAVKAQKEAEQREKDLKDRLDTVLKQQDEQQSLAESANAEKADQIKSLESQIAELQKAQNNTGLSDKEQAELLEQINDKDIELQKAIKKAERAEKKAKASEEKLQAEQSKPPVIPEATQKELQELRAQLDKAQKEKTADKAVLQVKAGFEMLKRDFNSMLTALTEIEDIEIANDYKNKMIKMAEVMKDTIESNI